MLLALPLPSPGVSISPVSFFGFENWELAGQEKGGTEGRVSSYFREGGRRAKRDAAGRSWPGTRGSLLSADPPPVGTWAPRGTLLQPGTVPVLNQPRPQPQPAALPTAPLRGPYPAFRTPRSSPQGKRCPCSAHLSGRSHPPETLHLPWF